MLDKKRYLLELGSALAGYAVLMFATRWAAAHFDVTGAGLTALAISPVVGAIATAWVILRAVRQMDELQRRNQYEAIAIAFMGTAVVSIGWALGEGSGLPSLPAGAVWPLMALFWVASMIAVRLRYR